MRARRAATIAALASFALGFVPRPPAGEAAIPLLGVTAVDASCATTPKIEDAVVLGDIVFVGTVLRTENGGRWATVRVEERWRGARDLADTIEVHGGPEGGSATSVERTFATSRYLFVVTNGPGYLVDNECTATTPWTSDLARLRPIDVSAAPDVVSGAQVTEIDWDRLLPAAALVGALVIAVIAYVVILRARRRPPDWMR